MAPVPPQQDTCGQCVPDPAHDPPPAGPALQGVHPRLVLEPGTTAHDAARLHVRVRHHLQGTLGQHARKRYWRFRRGHVLRHGHIQPVFRNGERRCPVRTGQCQSGEKSRLPPGDTARHPSGLCRCPGGKLVPAAFCRCRRAGHILPPIRAAAAPAPAARPAAGSGRGLFCGSVHRFCPGHAPSDGGAHPDTLLHDAHLLLHRHDPRLAALAHGPQPPGIHGGPGPQRPALRPMAGLGNLCLEYGAGIHRLPSGGVLVPQDKKGVRRCPLIRSC